jgi:hypothetical protein
LATAYIQFHAIDRFRERVDPWATKDQILIWLREFISAGTRLERPPEWTSSVPGCEYYTHPDWGPDVVAVYKPEGNAVITVRVPQDATPPVRSHQ